MNDPVEEKSKLVLDALQYAHDNNLDINNLDDVNKILEAIDIEKSESAEEFMNLLQNADTFMEMGADKIKSEKTDLPN